MARALTWDRGIEMTRHQESSVATAARSGCPVDPGPDVVRKFVVVRERPARGGLPTAGSVRVHVAHTLSSAKCGHAGRPLQPRHSSALMLLLQNRLFFCCDSAPWKVDRELAKQFRGASGAEDELQAD